MIQQEQSLESEEEAGNEKWMYLEAFIIRMTTLLFSSMVT